MTEIVASLPLMVAYPIAVALAANQSGRLVRELNQPLAAIHIEANAALELQKAAARPDWQSTRGRLSMVPVLREVLALVDHDLKDNDVATTIEFPGDGARFYFEIPAA